VDRYHALRAWVLQDETIRNSAAKFFLRYRPLRDYLLEEALVRFHQLSPSEIEPYVIGTEFYGKTFEDVVDVLPNRVRNVLDDDGQ